MRLHKHYTMLTSFGLICILHNTSPTVRTLSNHSSNVSPLMQTYQIMVLGVAYFLYAYARPYKTTFVNIIELALLACLGITRMLAQSIQQRYADNIQLNETSVDSCGKPVPSINLAWIMLGVLYLLPVTVLLFLLGKWISSRVIPLLKYVDTTISCVHVELKSVISYVYCGDVCVWCMLFFSHYTIIGRSFLEEPKRHTSWVHVAALTRQQTGGMSLRLPLSFHSREAAVQRNEYCLAEVA